MIFQKYEKTGGLMSSTKGMYDVQGCSTGYSACIDVPDFKGCCAEWTSKTDSSTGPHAALHICMQPYISLHHQSDRGVGLDGAAVQGRGAAIVVPVCRHLASVCVVGSGRKGARAGRREQQ